MDEIIGILHPGQMGISVAASAKAGIHRVLWASEGRSEATRKRAESQGLEDVGTLEAICQVCTLIISVCPPHGAEKLATQVAETGYRGMYLDANAIAPQKSIRIGTLMAEAGITYVDGGIIGGPAWEPGRTWLYLSGPGAEKAASVFDKGPLGTEVIGERIGDASALKMCFASYTKGTTALLCGVLATADRLGVRGHLEKQWDRGGPFDADQARHRVRRVTSKAWRFEGEMGEIASTFESVGIPVGFHRAAAEVYRRIAQFKAADSLPPLEDVLAALCYTGNEF